MTTRRPPGPANVPPRLETYRPSDERGGRPAQQAQGGGRMPPAHRPKPQSGSGGPLKAILIGALVVLAVIVAGAALLVFAMPTGLIRDQIVTQVRNKTGRELVIAGPSSFTLYPSLGLTMADVSLSGPPGMTDKPFVTMKGLDVSVQLLPLLKRDVIVDRLILKQPVFDLAVAKDGRKSWDLAPPNQQSNAGSLIRLAQAETAPAPVATDAPPPAAVAPPPLPDKPASLAALKGLQFSDVRIEKGTVNYSDARVGSTQTVSDIDLKLSLPALTGPLDADGTGTWNGEAVGIKGQVSPANALPEQAPAKVSLTITGNPLAGRYDGTVQLKDQALTDGTVDLNTQSLRSLAKWAGVMLPASQGFGQTNLRGTVRTAANAFEISNLDGTFDGTKISGDIAAATGGERPIVKGALKLSELDLNKYLGATPSVAAKSAPASAPAAKPATPPAAAPAQSIEELLNDGGASSPQVKGFTQRAGLSDEPLDLSALGGADVDLAIDSGRVLYGPFTVDRAKLKIALLKKVLNVTIQELAAFDGQAKGLIAVDGSSSKIASFGTNLTFDGLSIAKLATSSKLANLTGTAKLGGKIAMAGQGASQRQIAETLAGETLLSVANGNLTYKAATETHQVSALDMGLGATSLTGPLTAKGSLAWNGEKIAIDGALSTLKDLIDAKPVSLKATVAGRPVTASYDGTLAYAGDLAANGALAIKTPSLRTLAGWFGTALPPARGFGPLDLTGKLAASATKVSLTGAKLALDGETATGDLAVDNGGVRPAVKTHLKITGLDLNKYWSGAPASEAVKPAPAKPAETGTTAATPKAPEVRGYTQGSGWNTTPLDLAPLGAIDLDAKLALGRLVYNDIKVGQSALSVALRDRLLKTTFDEVQLYQGRGKGTISVDGRQGSKATVGANLAFDGVQALPLLKDAAGLNWLDGTGKLALNVTGGGGTQRQIIDSLAGKADIKLANGAIVGINIPGMMRNVSQGKLGGLSSAPSEKTDFSEFNSTWAIAGGIAQNSDLVLVSPLLRVSGAGKVLLGARQLDYTLKPKFVASLDGQGGEQNISGLEIPVRVSGSFEKPKFVPDAKALLRDPSKVIDTVKEIGKQLKGKNANEILEGLFGNKGQGGNAAPQPAAPQQ